MPDGRAGASSSSSGPPLGSPAAAAGSLVTVAFQILVSSLPSSKLNAESVATVNSLISTTVEQIKVALNCASHSWMDGSMGN
jgi:homeobox-leucine zipper protein